MDIPSASFSNETSSEDEQADLPRLTPANTTTDNLREDDEEAQDGVNFIEIARDGPCETTDRSNSDGSDNSSNDEVAVASLRDVPQERTFSRSHLPSRIRLPNFNRLGAKPHGIRKRSSRQSSIQCFQDIVDLNVGGRRVGMLSRYQCEDVLDGPFSLTGIGATSATRLDHIAQQLDSLIGRLTAVGEGMYCRE